MLAEGADSTVRSIPSLPDGGGSVVPVCLGQPESWRGSSYLSPRRSPPGSHLWCERGVHALLLVQPEEADDGGDEGRGGEGDGDLVRTDDETSLGVNRLRRLALAITVTELNLVAAAAGSGLSRIPENRSRARVGMRAARPRADNSRFSLHNAPQQSCDGLRQCVLGGVPDGPNATRADRGPRRGPSPHPCGEILRVRNRVFRVDSATGLVRRHPARDTKESIARQDLSGPCAPSPLRRLMIQGGESGVRPAHPR